MSQNGHKIKGCVFSSLVVSGVYPDFSNAIKMVHLEILEAIKGECG